MNKQINLTTPLKVNSNYMISTMDALETHTRIWVERTSMEKGTSAKDVRVRVVMVRQKKLLNKEN